MKSLLAAFGAIVLCVAVGMAAYETGKEASAARTAVAQPGSPAAAPLPPATPAPMAEGPRDGRPAAKEPRLSFKFRSKKSIGEMCTVYLSIEAVGNVPFTRFVKVIAIDKENTPTDNALMKIPLDAQVGTIVETTFLSTPCAQVNSLQIGS